MNYAQVAINAAVKKTFDYHIPPHLEGQLQVGHLVRVSFGTAMQAGIVVSLSDDSEIEETKPIIEILDATPVVTPAQLAVAHWMSAHYLAPIGLCLWLFLPPGITGKSTPSARLTGLTPQTALSEQEQAILELLQARSPLSISDIGKRARGKTIQQTLKSLSDKGLVKLESLLSPPPTKEKHQFIVELARPTDEIAESLARINGRKKQRILRYLLQEHSPVEMPLLRQETDATLGDLRALQDGGYIHLRQETVIRDSLADRYFIPTSPPLFTEAQQAVWQSIQQNPSALFLLHGVTGSGKTEIYLHAIQQTIEKGRQALLLVPEIALTPQTIRRVATRFPDQVAVVHGSLTYGERFDTWRRARNGEIAIIVGTRSALFTPLPALGLIILDEEHDPSYKQSPPIPPPYYHARDVAEQLAKHTDSMLILGSATPDIGTYYRAQKGSLVYLNLPNRIMGHREHIYTQARASRLQTHYQPLSGDAMTIDLPDVSIVDMREELKSGHRSIFSRSLIAALTATLNNHEQAILFLNRRGQSTYVFCRDCGYIAACPRCDTPLTYHRADELLHCHHCGHLTPNPTTCPSCGSRRIKYFGAGTQQVETEIKRLFPEARIVRWDADTATKHHLHETILRQFTDHKADFMIGTQMIAKGLDLPLVTLVGIVSADLGLALPDFRAGERVFQLLTQVSGRAGRGILGGRVILQTYQPQHYVIRAASTHDYSQFYERELAYRRQLGYPPFRRLARILFQHTHPIKAQEEAKRAHQIISAQIERQRLTNAEIMGPAPCFYRRIDRHYRWHLLIRSPNPLTVIKDVDIPHGWQVDLDPIDVL